MDWRPALAVAALLLGALACGGTVTAATTPQVAAPTPEMATLTLYNHSDRTVCYVYVVTPAGEYEWLDRLGPTEVVQPGERRVFFIEPGRYDMSAQDCQHNAIDMQFNVDLYGKIDWFVSGDGP